MKSTYLHFFTPPRRHTPRARNISSAENTWVSVIFVLEGIVGMKRLLCCCFFWTQYARLHHDFGVQNLHFYFLKYVQRCVHAFLNPINFRDDGGTRTHRPIYHIPINDRWSQPSISVTITSNRRLIIHISNTIQLLLIQKKKISFRHIYIQYWSVTSIYVISLLPFSMAYLTQDL